MEVSDVAPAPSLCALPRARRRRHRRASGVHHRPRRSAQAAGRRKAYLPLGGDLMTPGNEVASVDLDSGAVTRIKVGVRPQRIAIHPAGLVFVCNQFSNYITVIDPRTDQVLRNAQGPVEIET